MKAFLLSYGLRMILLAAVFLVMHWIGMCGAVIAGIQALGLRYGRAHRTINRQPALEHSAGLITAFKERFGTVSCGELIRDFPDVTSRDRKAHCAAIVAFAAEWVERVLAAAPTAP